MYVLIGKDNKPVVTLNSKTEAQQWADKFGWTLYDVPEGEQCKPECVKTGFLNLLKPSQVPSYRESFISFLPSEQRNFPDPTKLNIGDTFHKANLENMYFALPESVDPQELCLEFWNKLHERKLDLQRQVGDIFKVVSMDANKDDFSEFVDAQKIKSQLAAKKEQEEAAENNKRALELSAVKNPNLQLPATPEVKVGQNIPLPVGQILDLTGTN